MKKVLFIFLQCTWGIVQTLIGLGFFIALRKRPHRMYRGCIDTQWNHHGGLSLGLFIFTPPDEPLMLFVGIISVLWGDLPYFARMRRDRRLPYTACFVEAWASRWGELVTGCKAIWE